MKNISAIKALELVDKFKWKGINVSVRDIVILYALIDIYDKWLKWKLWKTTEIIKWKYIFIKNTSSLINNYYEEIANLRMNNKFRLLNFSKLWLIERIVTEDWRNSYFKPTELLYKYLK